MADDEKTSSSYGHFQGDTTRNEVQLDLNKFIDLLKETNELKEKIRDIESDTKVKKYHRMIQFSYVIDSWRIFPRIFISTYLILLYRSVIWFMGLDDPNTEQAALISTMVGAGAAWFGLYANTGAKKPWNVSYDLREYAKDDSAK